uniref:TRAUB domain-containing protein n=1 Tax=Panagrellus redivivus TaxID=6233 RepID=A0A7E4WAI8_PANRE
MMPIGRLTRSKAGRTLSSKTATVGDSADQTAKNLLTWTSFGSVNNVNKSERLSFDPVNHGPRDDVSFRPDQSTHYDTKSASFCNSPKSNRQRPSSVSSQFKSVLRSCMNQLPRSNSASRVLNRSLIS